jgi:hypothetical protein
MYRSRIVLAIYKWLGRVGNLLSTSFFWFWVYAFHSPERRLDQLQAGGGLGEHCPSPAVGRGVCAPPSRFAQPRLLAAD